MKTYTVQVPVAGAIDVEIEASSRSDAVQKALESVRVLLGQPGWQDKLEFIEAYERFFEGGVSQVELDEVVVTDESGFEVDLDEEELDGLDDDDDEGDGDDGGEDDDS